jgi:hypothetical protein
LKGRALRQKKEDEVLENERKKYLLSSKIHGSTRSIVFKEFNKDNR